MSSAPTLYVAGDRVPATGPKRPAAEECCGSTRKTARVTSIAMATGGATRARGRRADGDVAVITASTLRGIAASSASWRAVSPAAQTTAKSTAATGVGSVATARTHQRHRERDHADVVADGVQQQRRSHGEADGEPGECGLRLGRAEDAGSGGREHHRGKGLAPPHRDDARSRSADEGRDEHGEARGRRHVGADQAAPADGSDTRGRRDGDDEPQAVRRGVM
jgi:hypothetical protein